MGNTCIKENRKGGKEGWESCQTSMQFQPLSEGEKDRRLDGKTLEHFAI